MGMDIWAVGMNFVIGFLILWFLFKKKEDPKCDTTDLQEEKERMANEFNKLLACILTERLKEHLKEEIFEQGMHYSSKLVQHSEDDECDLAGLQEDEWKLTNELKNILCNNIEEHAEEQGGVCEDDMECFGKLAQPVKNDMEQLDNLCDANSSKVLKNDLNSQIEEDTVLGENPLGL